MRVFRLVTTGSVEEAVLERTKQKLILDEIVQRVGLPPSVASRRPEKLDLETLIKFSAQSVFQTRGSVAAEGLPDDAGDDAGDAQLLALNVEQVCKPEVYCWWS